MEPRVVADAARAARIRRRHDRPRGAALRLSRALPAGRGDESLPCGWAGDPADRCRCTPQQIQTYLAKISGPLLDRIDLHVDVPRLPPSVLREDAQRGESSAVVRERVVQARARQWARTGCANAHLDQRQTDAHCRLASEDRQLLERAIKALHLSARSLHRILRVARTIADLEACEAIGTAHLTEAIGYRRLERGAA
jgi:magnesium chelatase family protein